MARVTVNPTRMALSGIKKNLDTATKGYRLLKDKRDELIRQFLNTIRDIKSLRRNIDEKLAKSRAHLELAAAVMGEKELKTALLLLTQEALVEVNKKNVMSVILPQFFWSTELSDNDICSFGFLDTSSDLTESIKMLRDVRDDLLKLAELEKAVELMSGEIERTRRRVNALEYVIIPDYKETIKYIKMKLDEGERENSIRLLKVKDMIIEQNRGCKKSSDRKKVTK